MLTVFALNAEASCLHKSDGVAVVFTIPLNAKASRCIDVAVVFTNPLNAKASRCIDVAVVFTILASDMPITLYTGEFKCE